MTRHGGNPQNGTNPRTPPHDLNAEEALLGTALHQRDAAHTVATQTQPHDYYSINHQHIAAAIHDLYAENQPVDPLVVGDRLGKQGLLEQVGGIGEIVALQARGGPSSVANTYARIICGHAHRRRLITAAATLVDEAYTGADPSQTLEDLNQLANTSTADTTRYLNGSAWILDQPPGIPAVWGNDDEILWAEGEPLLIVGPAGVGKTTLVQQVVLARLGLDNQVIGYPVQPSEHPVLYLACDRPKQIARSFRRAVTPDHAHLLDRLVIWQGPPPHDFAKHPRSIVDMANTVAARTVFIDSLKDVASKLSDDETGAGINRAIQNAIAEGIEVASLHHQRKGQGGVKPRTLEDVYGSIWIPAGAGSVILLWGKAGDLTIELSHLKQPGSPVGPLELVHDHDTATTTVERGPIDALHVLRNTPHGLTSVDLAQRGSTDGPPSETDVKRAKRTLNRLAKNGLARMVKGSVGGPAGQSPDRYYPVDQTRQEEF